MKNIIENMAKLVSKIILRIFLIILFFFIILAITKINKNVLAFAETVEALGNSNTDNNENKFFKILEENQNQINNKYITASMQSSNQYPQNWLNEFNKKIIELQLIFPNDMYWNHMGGKSSNPHENNNMYSVTEIPCNHNEYGERYCNAYYGKSDDVYPYEATSVQCRGFASLLSDLVFGEDAPVRVFENYDELRIGDQARIDGDYHSVFIIDKTDEYVIVAECNEDLKSCKISWGRKIMREDMERVVCY